MSKEMSEHQGRGSNGGEGSDDPSLPTSVPASLFWLMLQEEQPFDRPFQEPLIIQQLSFDYYL